MSCDTERKRYQGLNNFFKEEIEDKNRFLNDENGIGSNIYISSGDEVGGIRSLRGQLVDYYIVLWMV